MFVLADSLHYYKSLEELAITSSDIGSGQAVALGEALKALKHLRLVELGGCSLSDYEIATLGEAIIKNPSIRVFDVANCSISDKAEKKLLRRFHGTKKIILTRQNISAVSWVVWKRGSCYTLSCYFFLMPFFGWTDWLVLLLCVFWKWRSGVWVGCMQ